MHRCEDLQGKANTPRIDMLEEKLKTQHQKMLAIQLQAEEAENRSRRNNIRIKGVSNSASARTENNGDEHF